MWRHNIRITEHNTYLTSPVDGRVDFASETVHVAQPNNSFSWGLFFLLLVQLIVSFSFLFCVWDQVCTKTSLACCFLREKMQEERYKQQYIFSRIDKTCLESTYYSCLMNYMALLNHNNCVYPILMAQMVSICNGPSSPATWWKSEGCCLTFRISILSPKLANTMTCLSSRGSMTGALSPLNWSTVLHGSKMKKFNVYSTE